MYDVFSVDLLNKAFEPLAVVRVGWCYSTTVEPSTRMAPIDDAKTTRTTAKRAVTVVARRLQSGVEMGMDSVVSMAKDLDLAYCDFVQAAADYHELCDQGQVDDTYLIVNGLNLEQYEANVKTLYKDTITAYRTYMSSAPAQGVISHPGASSQSVSGTFHLKKRDIPKFSGKRKDWPEFKAIWEKLVVPALPDKVALAAELKLSCKDGPAYQEVCTIAATSDAAYQQMWDSLCQHFDNVTLSVSSALDEIRDFRYTQEEDYQGVVKLIRQVESIYQQLEVLQQVKLVSNREVCLMVSYFPPLMRKDWAECYFHLDTDKQLTPFESFHNFLKDKLKINKQMADMQLFVKPKYKSNKAFPQSPKSFSTNVTGQKPQGQARCCIHGVGHSTDVCRQFASLSVQDRRDRLQKAGLCFRCFGNHRRAKCKEDSPCSNCSRTTHHTLMCFPKAGEPPASGISGGSHAVSAHNESEQVENQSLGAAAADGHVTQGAAAAKSYAAQGGPGLTLYAIYEVPVVSSREMAVVFCDDGSNTTFISRDGAQKLKSKRLAKTTVEITTLNSTESVSTYLHEVVITTTSGKKVPVNAIELPKLTGAVSQLDGEILSQIFPDFDTKVLQRPSGHVDILLGGDYFGLHPKRELASDGKNLSVMQGELGVCVQGSHPKLYESTEKDSHVGYSVRVVKSHSFHATVTKVSHPEFMPVVPKCAYYPVVQVDAQLHGHLQDVLDYGNVESGVSKHPHSASQQQSALCCGVSVPEESAFQPDVDDSRGSSSEVSTFQPDADDTVCSPEESDFAIQPDVDDNVSSQFASSVVPCSQLGLHTPPVGPPVGSEGNACLMVAAESVEGDSHFQDPVEMSSSGDVCGDLQFKLSGDSQSGQSHFARVPEAENFIAGERLGTEVNPKCGGCKCGKCPVVGHTYSFQEEQELKMIKGNLSYDADNQRWVTSYPWTSDPNLLPDNYPAALATLRNTEKRLLKEPEWAKKYTEQVYDMQDRGVARILSQQELESWTGPRFYLSHLAVENPKSTTTPVRIVFNSSQIYKGVSLNSFLAKGPDSFKTNLLGMLFRFREGPVVLIGDIKKMYNSVFLEELEQHTHRFLWRDLKTELPPDVWCITRVNMGDKPAGAIAIEAKDLTADLFHDDHPRAATFIKESSYVDDLVDSVASLEEAHDLAQGTDGILAKGGFKVKAWAFGGKGVAEANSEEQKVLGVHWEAAADVIRVKVHLNFSPKRRNVRTEPDLLPSQVPDSLPLVLTRRLVLQQVMGVFDPYGFLAPFMLFAKILLRETWTHKLHWDETLPAPLDGKWRQFFTQLLQVNDFEYERCVTPEGAVGNPQLILLSDGSELAYGCAVYIRWCLQDGSYWCRLLLSKCRIAPLNRVSVPQMELNGAVLSKRCRKVVEAESRFSFEKVFHLVDSETILGMIHKLSTRFRVYEGVRVGEIQAATAGDVSCWGWIPGQENIADWVTRPRSPFEIGPESEWIQGPSFLYSPFNQWQVRFKPSETGTLPGERKVGTHAVTVHRTEFSTASCLRCSSFRVVKWAFARILSALRSHSFKGGIRSNVTPGILKDAEKILIIDAQREWTPKSINDHFRTLRPVKRDGCWVVGTRISHESPLTPENEPQILLPYDHPLTKRIMRDAHCASGHRGRDATVARFRSRFWTSHATKLSKVVCESCQLCKRVTVKRMDQIMGQMPPARLKPAPPFTSVMLDLFGPYPVRGEVQKRTTGKAWGVIFTDLCCRAVHMEGVFGYDTESFLLAFSRFVSIRGWPSVIYSDPGSQLVGASEELKRVWQAIDHDVVKQVGADAGCEWKFGPADSPWYQGAAEALIKSAKRAIDLSVRGHRLSASELLTVLSQASDLLNERPLGVMPGEDSEISILTPNSLLLGRSASRNPGGYVSNPSLRSRITLIQGITDQFWKHWTSLYAPTLIHQTKWLHEERDLRVGDIVIVADSGVLKGEYRLARVSQVLPSADGRVRRVRILYKRYKVGEKLREYRGASDIEVERSVQKLALLVPVEDDE